MHIISTKSMNHNASILQWHQLLILQSKDQVYLSALDFDFSTIVNEGYLSLSISNSKCPSRLNWRKKNQNRPHFLNSKAVNIFYCTLEREMLIQVLKCKTSKPFMKRQKLKSTKMVPRQLDNAKSPKRRDYL